MPNIRNRLCGIAAMGFYLPPKEVPVADLAAQAGIPQFVVDGLGARTVREAAPDEYPADMAARAARDALQKGNLDPLAIDLIIYCGAGVPDYIMPSTAGRIQEAIGAANAFGFDMQQGCCSMLTAIQTAKAYIAMDEGIDTVMLVTGDKWSAFTHFHAADSVFFGDGGGAAVIRRGHPDLAPLCTEVVTQGRFYDLWYIPAGGLRHPASAATVRDGRHTYVCRDPKRARGEFKDCYVPVMVDTVKKALARCGLTAEQVAYFDMVNNNLKIQQIVLDRLGLPEERSSARYLQRFGHFGAQDIFLNLDLALRDGLLAQGDYILMLTAGIGFSWGCAVLQY